MPHGFIRAMRAMLHATIAMFPMRTSPVSTSSKQPMVLTKFVTHLERQAPRPGEAANQVIMNNCIRCHTDLNTTLVNTGKVDYMMTAVGEGKVCWDCHRNVPHGGRSNLAATPDAKVPLPDSPVPSWLQKMLK